MLKTDPLCPFVLPDVCKNCDHVIARHEYTFSVDDEYQVSKSLFVVVVFVYSELLMAYNSNNAGAV